MTNIFFFLDIPSNKGQEWETKISAWFRSAFGNNYLCFSRNWCSCPGGWSGCLLGARLRRNQRELVVYKSEIKLKRNSRKKLLHPFQIKHLFPTLLAFGRSSWMGTLSKRILVLGLPGFPNSPHSPFLLWTDILLGRPKVTTWSYYAVCRGPPKKKQWSSKPKHLVSNSNFSRSPLLRKKMMDDERKKKRRKRRC